MALALRDEKNHTYGDYVTWPEDVRYELIDGKAYAMSPAPSVDHQEFVLAIAAQARNALENHPCRVFVAPIDVRLPRGKEKDGDVDTVVQPDVIVVCDPEKVDRRGIRGAPDWVVEVLSPATAGHDQTRKRAAYERAGVREFWLVHPTDRLVTIYRLRDGEYGKPDVFELVGETPVGVLPEVLIDWARVTRRL